MCFLCFSVLFFSALFCYGLQRGSRTFGSFKQDPITGLWRQDSFTPKHLRSPSVDLDTVPWPLQPLRQSWGTSSVEVPGQMSWHLRWSAPRPPRRVGTVGRRGSCRCDFLFCAVVFALGTGRCTSITLLVKSRVHGAPSVSASGRSESQRPVKVRRATVSDQVVSDFEHRHPQLPRCACGSQHPRASPGDEAALSLHVTLFHDGSRRRRRAWSLCEHFEIGCRPWRAFPTLRSRKSPILWPKL